MNQNSREIFRAIHEGFWLIIEYHNLKNETTRYWISIKEIDPINGKIKVDGMHMWSHEIAELTLSIDRILSAKVIEGTYSPTPEELINDIRENPEKYRSIFSDIVNLKILDYLSRCNRLDQTPYKTKATLVEHLDDEILGRDTLELNDKQFDEIVKGFQQNTFNKFNTLQTVQLGMNLLSINCVKGIYVLAYKPLRLDVKNRTLKADNEIVICSEFTIDGEKQSVRQFLDEEDLSLLDDFAENAEIIRDTITKNNPNVIVDDMPYLIEIGRNPLIDLDQEYDGILKMYQSENQEELTVPIRAFFGELIDREKKEIFL